MKIGLQKQELEAAITGRFTMTTEHDLKHNEYLEINVELKSGIKDGEPVRGAITESIVKSLITSNGEYNNNYLAMKERVTPRIVFWPHEHPKYFHPSIKQKWVKKT